ncbi:MAG: metallophosphoesterase [Coriobacteriia bacterium]|nr:metallophosphoesterase [Coriobacteriia bacterium]
MTRVGLISDTHGWLDPRAIAALEREEPLAAIVHAGDIGGDPQVLYELGAIAPLTAVLGNCDAPIPGFDLPALASLVVADKRIAVIHDLASLGPIPAGVDIIVRGHSHIPGVQWRDGVLVANPGSATQRRNQPSCTVGVLEFGPNGDVEVRIVALDDLGARVR